MRLLSLSCFSEQVETHRWFPRIGRDGKRCAGSGEREGKSVGKRTARRTSASLCPSADDPLGGQGDEEWLPGPWSPLLHPPQHWVERNAQGPKGSSVTVPSTADEDPETGIRFHKVMGALVPSWDTVSLQCPAHFGLPVNTTPSTAGQVFVAALHPSWELGRRPGLGLSLPVTLSQGEEKEYGPHCPCPFQNPDCTA